MAIDGLISRIKSGMNQTVDSEVESEEISEAPDLTDLLEPDPKPVRERSAPTPPKRPAKAPTKAVQTEVADALTMMITLPAGMLSLKDPICGTAILNQVDDVVKRLVPIICRNPAMLKWFTGSSGYMDFIALATALAPIAKTIWSHHVTKSIGHEDDYEEMDFSNYSAPVFSG